LAQQIKGLLTPDEKKRVHYRNPLDILSSDIFLSSDISVAWKTVSETLLHNLNAIPP
jgi:hypothetical protein